MSLATEILAKVDIDWRGVTFDEAERRTARGDLDLDTWRAYCYAWRDGAWRLSHLGKFEAAVFAKRHDLPPARSDRPHVAGAEA